jgi:ParB family chromosome partitioning protein
MRRGDLDGAAGVALLLRGCLVSAVREETFEEVLRIPLALIDPSPTNPRKKFGAIDELASDLKQHGLLQAIVLRRTAGDRFEIIAGERRYRAAKQLGWAEIPAVLRQLDDAGEVLERQLDENLQREDLTALEEAVALGQLRDLKSYSVKALAKRLSVSQETVYMRLKLLDAGPTLRGLLEDGIDPSAALPIARLTLEEQVRFFKMYRPNEIKALRVRDATARVSSWRGREKWEAENAERQQRWDEEEKKRLARERSTPKPKKKAPGNTDRERMRRLLNLSGRLGKRVVWELGKAFAKSRVPVPSPVVAILIGGIENRIRWLSERREYEPVAVHYLGRQRWNEIWEATKVGGGKPGLQTSTKPPAKAKPKPKKKGRGK